MMRIFFLLFLLISVKASAQKQGKALLDSLTNQLPRITDPLAKTSLYLKISDACIDIDLNKAQLYADSGARLANTVHWKEGIARSEVNQGNICNFRGDYHEALAHNQTGYRIYKELGIQNEIGRSLYALGMAYERLSNFTEASRCYFESLRIFEKIPGYDRQTGNSLSAVAVIYFLQKDFKKSLDYSAMALQKQESAKNDVGIANELTAMADTYYELKDSSHAAKYNQRAFELFKSLGDKTGEGVVCYQMGRVNGNNDQLALEYLFRAKKLFHEVADSSNTAIINLGEIGRIYFRMLSQGRSIQFSNQQDILPRNKTEMLQQSENYLQQAVLSCKNSGDLENESVFSADLASLQAFKGDYKNAFMNYRLFHETQDSIFSQDSKNKIAALETQREVSLKNKEIENKELQISNQHKKMGLLLSGIVFLTVLGMLLIRQNQISRKTNNKLGQLNRELAEANNVKAKFFGIISHDLRSPLANLLNFIQLQKRKPGLLTEDQIAERENKITGSTKALLETMETTLLWSKGQMSNFHPGISLFPVGDLFIHLKKYFSETATGVFIFSDPQQLEIHSDKHYLQTIMHNLSANALNALKNIQDAKIEWKAWRENSEIHLSISDNGPGVHTEKISALYDETVSSGSRQGLGLHIIRDLAKAINCRISLQHNNSQGTTFRLTLQNIRISDPEPSKK